MTWDQTEALQASPPGPYAPPGAYTVTGWWQPAVLQGMLLSTAAAQAQFSPEPVLVTVQEGTPPSQQQAQPSAPTGLNALVGIRGIGLGWTPGPGDVSFNIYRRTGSGTYGAPVVTQINGHTALITDGTPGVMNYFVVRAVAVGGFEGPPSNEV